MLLGINAEVGEVSSDSDAYCLILSDNPLEEGSDFQCTLPLHFHFLRLLLNTVHLSRSRSTPRPRLTSCDIKCEMILPSFWSFLGVTTKAIIIIQVCDTRP